MRKILSAHCSTGRGCQYTVATDHNCSHKPVFRPSLLNRPPTTTGKSFDGMCAQFKKDTPFIQERPVSIGQKLNTLLLEIVE